MQGQDRDCDGGGVDTSTAFVLRYTLNTVAARFA